MNAQIIELYTEHNSIIFPKGFGGEEIDGIDLVLLTTDTSGCAQTYVSNGGSLDLWRTAILGLCYRDLAMVVAKLDGAGKEYFLRLEKLAGLLLSEIAQREK